MNCSTTFLNLSIFFISFILTVGRNCIGTSHDGAIYSFGYAVEAVETGVLTRHWEERRGDTVRGGYSLLDPDGRVRVVLYQVEGTRGFKAVVTFRPPGGQRVEIGHLKYPHQYHEPVYLQRPIRFTGSSSAYQKKAYSKTLSLY